MDGCKGAIAILVFTGMIMLLCSGFFPHIADGRADFSTLANKSTRFILPRGHDVNGTAAHTVVSSKGCTGMGNLGIGNGSIASLTSGTIKNETLLPEKTVAATVYIDNVCPSMIVGQPLDNILNEYPVQCATIYGKLVGLWLTGGHVANIGFSSIGYEY